MVKAKARKKGVMARRSMRARERIQRRLASPAGAVGGGFDAGPEAQGVFEAEDEDGDGLDPGEEGGVGGGEVGVGLEDAGEDVEGDEGDEGGGGAACGEALEEVAQRIHHSAKQVEHTENKSKTNTLINK